MSFQAEALRPHMAELRSRTFKSCAAVIIASITAYIFSEEITRLFMEPLAAASPALIKLIYTNLTEAFITYLKVAVLVGLIASFPILLYQGWMFIAPGLKKNEKKFAGQVVFWSTLLFAGGVAFAYFLVLPKVLGFFLGFSGTQLEPMPKLSSYLTFVARTCLAFGLAFEIPFLMVMITRFGLVARDYFKEKRKYYYPAILVLALLLTTGDLLSAILLAVPLFGLYESGILIIRIFISEKKGASPDTPTQAA